MTMAPTESQLKAWRVFTKLPLELFDGVFDPVFEDINDEWGWDYMEDIAINRISGLLVSQSYQPTCNNILAVNTAWRTRLLERILLQSHMTFTNNCAFGNFFTFSSQFVLNPGECIKSLSLKMPAIHRDRKRSPEDLLASLKTLARRKLLPKLEYLVVDFEEQSGRWNGERWWAYVQECSFEDGLFQKVVQELKRIRVSKAHIFGLEDHDLGHDIEQCITSKSPLREDIEEIIGDIDKALFVV